MMQIIPKNTQKAMDLFCKKMINLLLTLKCIKFKINIFSGLSSIWLFQCSVSFCSESAAVYIQMKVSYSYCCILSEKRRNLTQIKIQTFADAK